MTRPSTPPGLCTAWRPPASGPTAPRTVLTSSLHSPRGDLLHPRTLDASCGSDGQFCLHERHRTSGEQDPMAVQLAQHLATALGQLLGLQLRCAQPRRPIGCQCTVGRPRDRIFGNAILRSKEATDELALLPWGSHDDPPQIKGTELRMVGRDGADDGLAVEHHHIVIGGQDVDGLLTHPLEQGLGWRAGAWWTGGEIHDQQRTLPLHDEITTACLESNSRSCMAKMLKEHMCCGQGRMSTQVNLGERREPAQMKPSSR